MSNNLEQGYSAADYDLGRYGKDWTVETYCAMLTAGKVDAFATGYKTRLGEE